MQQHITLQYNQHKHQLIGQTTPWMTELREQALTHFLDQGLPTIRDEHYKYTNLDKLKKIAFEMSHIYHHVDPKIIDDLQIDEANYRLVFINSVFSMPLSKLPALNKNFYLNDFASALTEKPALLKQHLGKQTDLTNSIAALNTALYQGGVVIALEENTLLTQPIELLYLHTQNDNAMQHLRNLIILGENASATVIEKHDGLGAHQYLKTFITEISCAKNSVLHYYKIQAEGEQAYHLNEINIHQKEASQFIFHSIDSGGKLVRNDVNCHLQGENAFCQLEGLYLSAGKQHIDNHTFVHHESPFCTSKEVYKGIIDDKSRAVFNGRVLVAKNAMKTNAQQKNANLLLSDEAEIDTKPQLEIYADDVSCSHGATVGQLDETSLFYLLSRGICQAEAEALLTFGFAKSLLNKISAPKIRQKMMHLLLNKLDKTGKLKEYIE